VLYRIKKIEEITGLKLNDPEDRFNFHLSLKLDQIK
ncbi:MAG: PucR family transcriptional regulator, partial [Clostridia bacterium]|nr:PucR family transcriptional regulator [Clostridia bacterium]